MMKASACLAGVVLLSGLVGHGAHGQNDGGAWTTQAPLPTPRQEMPHVLLDGKIYVPGGIGADRQGSAVMEVYDPATDAWAAAAPLPIPLHHLGAAAAGGRLYVLGGYLGNPFSPSRRVFSYDPATDAWTEKTGMPAARGAHAAVAVDGRLYVVGGFAGGTVTQVVLEYDPMADGWTERAEMPSPREHLAAAALDGRIYVVGGRVFEDFGLQDRRDLHVYDPAADAWQRLASMPTARGGLAAAAANGRLYVFGGETFEGGPAVFDENEEYDPRTDTWRAMAPLPLPRHGSGAVTLDGSIHLVGGGVVAGFSTTDDHAVYRPPPVPTATEDAAAPGSFGLFPNYPNPFNPATTLRFAVPAAARVTLTIHDVLGRTVETVLDAWVAPGIHTVTWEAGPRPSGLYLARLHTGAFAATRRLTLLR